MNQSLDAYSEQMHAPLPHYPNSTPTIFPLITLRNYLPAPLKAVPFLLFVLIAAASCHASSTVVFQDNFETSSGTTPLAQIGSYSGTAGDVVTVGTATHPATAPAGGSRILDCGTGKVSYGMLSGGAVTSGRIRVEFDAVLESGSHLQMRLSETNSTSSHSILISLMAGGVVGVWKNGAYYDSGLTHTVGEWQHYVLEYTFGKSSYTLRAGNMTDAIAGPFYGDATTLTSISCIAMRRGSTSTGGYFDNVFVRKNYDATEDPFHSNRRELFVDDSLTDQFVGDIGFRLHQPVDRGMVFKPGEMNWEKPSTNFCTVIEDGGVYKLYYRSQSSTTNGAYSYAESTDGINWTRPNLGIHEFGGSTNNNIIIQGNAGGHSFSPFLDKNPKAPASQKYKALALRRTVDNTAWELIAFASPDGIHWTLMQEDPVMTGESFDSQNVAFFSEVEGKYVAYYRTKTNGLTGLREISRATSNNFLNWSAGTTMAYERFGQTAPFEELYINQTAPYFRAPHLFIATAARFMSGRQALTDEQLAQMTTGNFGDCSDAVLLSTRGGYVYQRLAMEAWIRPGIGLENWGSRSNYPALGVVQTGTNEMSVYVCMAYGLVEGNIRRYSMRLDGFMSINAGYDPAEMITRPFICPGGELTMNFSTSAPGYIKVEVLDENSQPISGYTESACPEAIGDEIARKVFWNGTDNLDVLRGRSIRLRFIMKDADLYALQFVTP